MMCLFSLCFFGQSVVDGRYRPGIFEPAVLLDHEIVTTHPAGTRRSIFDYVMQWFRRNQNSGNHGTNFVENNNRQAHNDGNNDENDHGSIDIFQEIRRGNLFRIQRVLDRGSIPSVARDVSYVPRDVPFKTPVFLSLWYGHDHLVSFFLKHEENAAFLQKRRTSPSQSHSDEYRNWYRPSIYHDFSKACKFMGLKTIRRLVEHFGPEVVRPAAYYSNWPNAAATPLHHACARAHLPLIQFLLKNGITSKDMNDSALCTLSDLLTAPLASPSSSVLRSRLTPLHWLGLRLHQNVYNASTAAQKFPRDGKHDFQLTETLHWLLAQSEIRPLLLGMIPNKYDDNSDEHGCDKDNSETSNNTTVCSEQEGNKAIPGAHTIIGLQQEKCNSKTVGNRITSSPKPPLSMILPRANMDAIRDTVVFLVCGGPSAKETRLVT